MKAVSLFSGIGGFELGFKRAGIPTEILCECLPTATAVLKRRFPGADVVDDVRRIKSIPHDVSILTAGFPCQDLSSVGAKAGMNGRESSLVSEVFRILRKNPVEWVIFENVRFMLHLHKGQTMRDITSTLESLGYKWCYRLLDSSGFGLPQRRHRVYIVASKNFDPRGVLFRNPKIRNVAKYPLESAKSIGFYWTEGRWVKI